MKVQKLYLYYKNIKVSCGKKKKSQQIEQTKIAGTHAIRIVVIC